MNAEVTDMVTHVACINPKCSRYGVAKTVASAMILGLNEKICRECGGHMKVAVQINTSFKRGNKGRTYRKYSRKRGNKR